MKRLIKGLIDMVLRRPIFFIGITIANILCLITNGRPLAPVTNIVFLLLVIANFYKPDEDR